MALPVGIETCEITIGPFTTFRGEPVTGFVSITPSRALVWTATGTPILPKQEQIALDATGSGSIRLPCTDQDGFSDGAGHAVKDWTYTVECRLAGAPNPPASAFQVPSGPASMDLDLSVPVSSSTGVTVALPVVLSVNGQTGNVTIAGGGGGGAVSSVAGRTGAVTLAKGDVGLGSVDNTADSAKPVSAATAAALAGKTALVVPTPVAGTDAANKAYVDSVAGGGGGSNALTSETVTAGVTLSTGSADVVEVNSATDVTVTLPTGMSGRSVEVFQAGAGVVTVAPAGGVAARVAPPATGLKTPGRYGSVFARARGASSVSAPPASGMLLRFRADDVVGSTGSNVASWAESSGNGHPAAVQATTGAQPKIIDNSGGTGHRGVSFTGSSFMTLSGSALGVARNRGALTVFAALAFPTAVTTGTRTVFALSSGSSATSARVLLGHRNAATGVPTLSGRRLDADALASATGAAITTVTNTLLTGRLVWSASDAFLYQDGAQAGTNASFQTDGVTSDTESLAGVLGANLAGAAEFFQGHILELLVYGDADAALRQAVGSYVAQTYGVAVSDAVPAEEWIVSGGVA